MNNKKGKVIILGMTLAATLSFIGVMGVYHSHVDHLNTPCPFNCILGVDHQVNWINDELGQEHVNSEIIYVKDGKVGNDAESYDERYIVIKDEQVTFKDGDLLQENELYNKIKL